MFLTPEQQARDETTHPKQLKSLAAQSIELARIVAANSGASPKLLKKLAKSVDKTTREMVATNPNTPTKVLMQLGVEFPQQLLDNPLFSLLLLENPQFLTSIPLKTLASLITLSDISPNFLVEYGIRACDRQSLLKVLYRLDTSKTILERLVDRSDREISNAAKLHINWVDQKSLNRKSSIEQQLIDEIFNVSEAQNYFVILENFGFCVNLVFEIARKHKNRLIRRLAFNYKFLQLFLNNYKRIREKTSFLFEITKCFSPLINYLFIWMIVCLLLFFLLLVLLWLGALIVLLPTVFESLANFIAVLLLAALTIVYLPISSVLFWEYFRDTILILDLQRIARQYETIIPEKVETDRDESILIGFTRKNNCWS